jgi:hypothetical protein
VGRVFEVEEVGRRKHSMMKLKNERIFRFARA